MSLEARIQLDGNRSEYGPGHPIQGRIIVRAEAPWRANRAHLTLEWYTEGRGDQDRRMPLSIALVEPGTEFPARMDRPFQFIAPALPWSYPGHLIKLNWCLGLYLLPARGEPLLLHQDLVIHPRIARG